MTITGPTGPSGNTPIGTPGSSVSDSLGDLNSVRGTHSSAPSAEVTEGESAQDVAQAEPSQQASLDDIIEKASRLVPPEQRADFLELVKDMSATDPLLQSMIRRLEGGTR